MIGKVIVGILAVFLLLGAFRAPISDGIKGWRTEDSTQSFVVETGGGVTTANVTLSSDLFQADVAEVIGITSNISETPAASSYVEATKLLNLSGLAESQTRSLDIEYYAETDSDVLRVVGPFLAFLIFGGLLFAIVFGIFGGFGRSRR